MAEPFITNVSSEPTDGSAGQPKRYAHGSDQLASLARWLANERDEAEREMWQYVYSDQLTRGLARRDAMQAFEKVISRLTWASESNNASKV
jgi:hypothetical protein